MKLTDDILRVEQENKLFEIENKKGLKVWEAIRYSVNTQILRHMKPSFKHLSGFNKTSFFFSLKRIWKFLIYTLTHHKCKTMFVLCSRSIHQDQYCDIIMDNLYEMANKQEAFVIETTFNWDCNNYKYGNVCPSLTTLAMRLCKPKYDFSEIIDIVKKEFDDIELDAHEIKFYYKFFLAQFYFYNIFFKIFRFNRIFFVQGGVYKGLIAAAKNNNVKIIELQHAQLSRNHFAYSYPKNINKGTLYNPDYLLTFGPLWLKDSSFPGVNVVPLGNDFYCTNISSAVDNKKKILVVSTLNHHKKLIELVKDISFLDSSFHFIYKLHPEEYHNYRKYSDSFAKFNNVEVITNEISVSEAISKTELTLLIQSTVMVETLNAGKRVFIYKALDYEVMDFLYSEAGINFVNDASSFIETYEKMDRDIFLPTDRFFMPFDKEVASVMLKV